MSKKSCHWSRWPEILKPQLCKNERSSHRVCIQTLNSRHGKTKPRPSLEMAPETMGHTHARTHVLTPIYIHIYEANSETWTGKFTACVHHVRRVNSIKRIHKTITNKLEVRGWWRFSRKASMHTNKKSIEWQLLLNIQSRTRFGCTRAPTGSGIQVGCTRPSMLCRTNWSQSISFIFSSSLLYNLPVLAAYWFRTNNTRANASHKSIKMVVWSRYTGIGSQSGGITSWIVRPDKPQKNGSDSIAT